MLMLAQRRISFDQLLVNQLQAIDRRNQWVQGNGHPFVDHSPAEAFMNELPFTLTTAQSRALSEIQEDISASAPMARLLEGDVGSGKTVVALSAMLSAVANRFQAVLMAPTEVQAEQHYRTLLKLMSRSDDESEVLAGMVQTPGFDRNVRMVLLTGSTKGKERNSALDALRH